MKITEVLGNTDLADDMEISIGDKGKFTLGELRQMGNQLSEHEKALQNLAGERDKYRSDLENTNARFSELLSKAGAEADKPAPEVDVGDKLLDTLRKLVEKPRPGEAVLKDNVFGDAFNQIEERAYSRARADIEKLAEKQGTLEKTIKEGFTATAAAQAVERAWRWYDTHRSDLPKDEKGKLMTLEAIDNYARENNMIVPKTNLLDYDRALDTLNAPVRHQAALKEAEERAYQKGLADARRAGAEVIPLFADRSAGAAPGEKINTAGKTSRQMVSEQIGRGLADLLSAENE